MNSMPPPFLSKHLNILSFALISAVFYLMAYYSVSGFLPTSIPVHHDDYTNYSSAAGGLALSWIRPLSTWLMTSRSAFTLPTALSAKWKSCMTSYWRASVPIRICALAM